MPLMAVAFPILPGKTAEWRTWMEELNGSRRQEFAESRRRAGVRERTFLQSTPMGDLVIVTLEGDDPGRAFGQMMGATDAFTTWFLERVKAVHGVDLTVPMTGSPSELVIDTAQVDELAK
jgi:LmbE family N-acetylglucosaminyl deacetylase